MTRIVIRPLGTWAYLFYPLARLLSRDRVLLERRHKYTQELRERARAERKMIRELAKEAIIFAQCLQSCYTRLGEVHLPTRDYQNASGQRKGRAHYVRFDYIFTQPEIITFKLKIGRRTLFGGYRNALPYGVFAQDLIREDTLKELSYACNRVVSAVADDPNKGIFVLVHRMEGVGGLPGRVLFRDILEKYPADMSRGTLVLGVGEHRRIHDRDLFDHPHIGIAGATKSGKSNILNNLICGLMWFTDPKDVRFIPIDLKRLEFSAYKKSPHLLRPEIDGKEMAVITDEESAIAVLNWVVEEINRRTALIEDQAKEISEWNEQHPDQALPRIIVVIDEFAELMLANSRHVRQDTERLVVRITNLGRAVGVHMWICTQHPQVKVLPNNVKLNMQLVIAGRTQNKSQSVVVIGTGAAAELPLIPGRMIYQSGSEQHTIQTPYIDMVDIRQAVAISCGRGVGLIAIDEIEPVIIKEKLREWVVEHGGRLSLELAPELADYAITRAMFKDWLAWAQAQPDFIYAGHVYKTLRRSGVAQYIAYAEVIEASPVELAPAPTTEQQERAAVALETWRNIRRTRELARENGGNHA